jgi:hypothetical protein
MRHILNFSIIVIFYITLFIVISLLKNKDNKQNCNAYIHIIYIPHILYVGYLMMYIDIYSWGTYGLIYSILAYILIFTMINVIFNTTVLNWIYAILCFIILFSRIYGIIELIFRTSYSMVIADFGTHIILLITFVIAYSIHWLLKKRNRNISLWMLIFNCFILNLLCYMLACDLDV